MTDEKRDVIKVDKKLEKNAIEILDMIAGGADELTVCTYFSIRRGTFIQWMIQYPQFESAVQEARKQRADSFRTIIHDRIHEDEIDEETGLHTGNRIIREIGKDQVPGEKLLFEKLKWLAEVDNPEKYGTRVKHEGNMTMPVQIVVDTGIKAQNNKIKAEAIETEVVEDHDLL